MLTQRVGDLVAHHRGDLVVGELQLLDQPGIEDDLAARAAVGIQLGAVDDIHFPGPLRGIRAEYADLGDQPLGDAIDALGNRRVLSSTPLLAAALSVS